jgi:SHS2 domain-containing protein
MGITHRIAGPQEGADRGHRKALHPADLRIEAWGPTREECIAEAVRGLVDSFAIVAGRPHARAERHLTAPLG